MWVDKLRGCPAIEVRDEASTFTGKAQELENPYQLSVVRGGKCSVEV
jgi:hypothetical protein